MNSIRQVEPSDLDPALVSAPIPEHCTSLFVLPALLRLGVTSYSRPADLAVHDAYHAPDRGRIRAFYRTTRIRAGGEDRCGHGGSHQVRA